MCKADNITKSNQVINPVNRVIIFDWDDTICPTTFCVTKANVDTSSELPQHIQNIFDELCKCAEKLLIESSKHGEVIIITNGEEGWVEYSAKCFVPKLIPILEGIKVVSARSEYESFFPKMSLCWKAAAFAHEVNKIFNRMAKRSSFDESENLSAESSTPSCSASSTSSSEKRRREIISFGDSTDERTAVQIAASQLNASSKSVKFIAYPSPTEIIGQLSIMISQLNYICGNLKDMDVEISKPHATKTADSILNHRINRNANRDALKTMSNNVLRRSNF